MYIFLYFLIGFLLSVLLVYIDNDQTNEGAEGLFTLVAWPILLIGLIVVLTLKFYQFIGGLKNEK